MDAQLSAETLPLSIRDLEAQITELAGHLNAGNYRWLKLIAEFDRRNGWSDGGSQSCAHWLNWKCGLDLGAARERVRVAHALEKLPKIAASMARGCLSYSKVRALSRVASAATEDYFLSIALHGTAGHVEKLVRYYRGCQQVEALERDARQQANRAVQYSYDEDGSLILKARLPAEIGALFLKALSAAMNHSPRADVSAETSPDKKPSFSMRRADALGVLAESFLKHGAEALHGGDRHQIVIHVDAHTLRDNEAGCCELEHGPSLAAETVRRLACDASVVTLIENDKGEPLDIGRKTRSISPALRRALNARDRGCRFPGCCNTKYVDAHHIHHWAHGGETKASNLVTLCRFHHRKVHEGGIRIEILDDGAFRFIQANGESIDSFPLHRTQPLGDWARLVAQHAEQDIHIDRTTAVTRWRGEAMDYGLAVEVLLGKERRGKDVSAETLGNTRFGF